MLTWSSRNGSARRTHRMPGATSIADPGAGGAGCGKVNAGETAGLSMRFRSPDSTARAAVQHRRVGEPAGDVLRGNPAGSARDARPADLGQRLVRAVGEIEEHG